MESERAAYEDYSRVLLSGARYLLFLPVSQVFYDIVLLYHVSFIYSIFLSANNNTRLLWSSKLKASMPCAKFKHACHPEYKNQLCKLSRLNFFSLLSMSEGRAIYVIYFPVSYTIFTVVVNPFQNKEFSSSLLEKLFREACQTLSIEVPMPGTATYKV